MAPIDLLGYAGALAVVLAYAFVTRSGSSLRVHALNLFGAGAIVANAAYHGAYPSVALNVAWIVIATYGIVHVLRARRASAPPGV